MNAQSIPSRHDRPAAGAAGAPAKRRRSFEHGELDGWRRRATDLILLASASLHVPLLVLFFLGYRGIATPASSTYFTVASLVIVWAAVFRGIDYRVRAWIVLADLYVSSVIGSIAFPGGPYMRALPVVAPVFAIGLLGIRSAVVSSGISAVVLMSTPALLALSEAAGLLGGATGGRPVQPDAGWLQGAALLTNMTVLMVLLVRLHEFLLRSLGEQKRAISQERKSYGQLEAEMNARLRLEREITRIEDEERRRTGTEIHDGVCQQLTGALLRCQALELRLEREDLLTEADLGALSALLSETLDEARAVAHGLLPIGTDSRSLMPALRKLVRRTQEVSGVPCELVVGHAVPQMDSDVAQHFYRIAQEALSNASRHAGATQITVTLEHDEDALTLTIQDDGKGLDSDLPSDGMGLQTMAYRADILGAGFRIDAKRGEGTRVTCSVPRFRNSAHDERLSNVNQEPAPWL